MRFLPHGAVAFLWCLSALGLACSGSVVATSDSGYGGGDGGGQIGGDGGTETGVDATVDASLEAAPGGEGGVGICASAADCAAGRVCGFRFVDGCSATGSCFPAPGATCLSYAPGCACDGTEVNITCNGLPSGYAPKPLLHTGSCRVSDAGTSG